jgi:hypothetical protein
MQISILEFNNTLIVCDNLLSMQYFQLVGHNLHP